MKAAATAENADGRGQAWEARKVGNFDGGVGAAARVVVGLGAGAGRCADVVGGTGGRVLGGGRGNAD